MSTWIPTGVAAAGALLFLGILLVHLAHAWRMEGEVRAWHLTHALMALGMIDMFWPWGAMPVGASVGVATYGVLAAVTAGTALSRWRQGPTRWLWLWVTVDAAGMAYMFTLGQNGVLALSLVVAAWFTAGGIAWLLGLPARLTPTTSSGHVRAVPAAPGSPASGPGLRHGSTTTRAPAPPVAPTTATPPTGVHARGLGAVDLRVSLGLMGLGMAFMVLAMQLAPMSMSDPSMPTHMGGMDGMGGMHSAPSPRQDRASS